MSSMKQRCGLIDSLNSRSSIMAQQNVNLAPTQVVLIKSVAGLHMTLRGSTFTTMGCMHICQSILTTEICENKRLHNSTLKRIQGRYVSGESGECRKRTGLLDVLMRDPSGEVRVALGRGWGGHSVGAVDEGGWVLAQNCQLLERGLERSLKLGLAVCRVTSNNSKREGRE